MKAITKIGVMLLAIGLAFVVGTMYRSTSTKSFGYGNLIGLKSNSWNSAVNQTHHVIYPYFWSPRDLRLDVNCNSTIDIYILDSEGIRLWTSDRILKPVWSAMGVSQEIFTLQINSRDTYAFLVYNPTNMISKFEINATIYGYEKDLFLLSVVFVAIGLIALTISLILNLKNKTKKVV